MAQAFLITLREGLEMALIVVIVLAYLRRTRRSHLSGRVWQGVVAAIGLSLVVGAVLFGFGRELDGRSEEVFEGAAMLLAALVLTWMIIWTKSQSRGARSQLEGQVEKAVSGTSAISLALVAFLAVGREGIETTVFLFSAVKTATPVTTIVGGLIGLGVAMAVGRMIYQGSHRVNLRVFFNITGILLILFAAGLLARGLHEFQEAGILPVFIEHVWDINDRLSEKGVFGSLLKGIFGYNGNPSLLEVVVYPVYLLLSTGFFVSPNTTRSAPFVFSFLLRILYTRNGPPAR